MGLFKFVGWLLTNAVALAVACQLFDGIGFHGGATSGMDEVSDKIWPLIFVALILGVVNSFVSPVLKFLSIPFMLLFTEWLAGLFDIDFYVDGFWTAVGGAIVITIVTWIVGLLLGDAQED